MTVDPATRAAIVRAATENGIDPAAALAIAERESSFNPSAHSSKTIHGLYQMRGDLRRQYGVGDSEDPYAQAKGWGTFFKDNKGEMARVLGRDVTDEEGYLGHHFGGTKAARMLKMDPSTPVNEVFTDYERSINPHFDKAGTVGALNSSVMADVSRRKAKFGGSELPDFASLGSPLDSPQQGDQKLNDGAQAPDFSSFGRPVMASMVNPAMQDQAKGMKAVDGDYTRSMNADGQNPGGARNNEITPETLMDLRVGPRSQPDTNLDPMERQPPDLSQFGRPV